MMKKMGAVLLMLAVLLLPVSAGDHFHISFSVGAPQAAGLFGRSFTEPMPGVNLSYGMNLGLSGRFEMSLGMVSSLVPEPWGENTVYAEFQAALLGRMSEREGAGRRMNMLVGLGGFYSFDSTGYRGAGPYISWTPVTLGNPMSGRRERILRTVFGWDFVNNKAVLAFSPVEFDFYVRGTYRDRF